MDSNEFAEMLDKIGWTQKKLAEIMGISPQEINRIIRGERKPPRVHAAFIRYIADHEPRDPPV